MKITIYTITDCQFSKQEKDYLKSHNLAFEEKNLETNHEFLTEMLNISSNFAGTPVTVIEKDVVSSSSKSSSDQASKPEENKSEFGDITKKDEKRVILKGFTVEEFDTALGFSKKEGEAEAKDAQPKKEEPKKIEEKKDEKPLVTVQTNIQTPPIPAPAAQQPPSMSSQAQQPPVQMPQQPPTAQPQAPTTMQPANNTPQNTMSQPTPTDMQMPQTAQPQINVDPSLPATPPTDTPITDDSLDAILKDLQEKAGVTESSSQTAVQNPPTQPQAVAQAPQPPQQPQAPAAPAIPDFGSSS